MYTKNEISALSKEEFRTLKAIVLDEYLYRYENEMKNRVTYGPFTATVQRNDKGDAIIVPESSVVDTPKERILAEDILRHINEYFAQWFVEGFALKLRIEKRPVEILGAVGVGLSTNIEWEGELP